MQPYETLSHRGQIPRLRRLAEAVLAEYGLAEAPLRLLSHRATTLFRVAGPDRGLILRVYRPPAPPAPLVAAELAWLAALRRDTDLRVPEPVPAQDGRLLVEAAAPGLPGAGLAVLFRPVPGRFLDAGLTPARLAQVGALMAGLHAHAVAWAPPPGFVRPRWDSRAAFGPNSVFGPGGAGLALSPAARAVFAAAAEQMRAELPALEASPDNGRLIHADLQQTNYLFAGDRAGAIDFDDCCWGHFLFDMTITLFEVADRPEGAALRAAFFAGYDRVRPLPAAPEAGIRTFTAIRLAKRINYLASAPDPALRARAPGWVAYAVRWLRGYLAG